MVLHLENAPNSVQSKILELVEIRQRHRTDLTENQQYRLAKLYFAVRPKKGENVKNLST